MPTVKLRFPGGRYHATPWGHHVNEGLIEWPPSPWRLLRAFIACGFSSQGWSDVPPIARRLLDKLAAVLPSYRLPVASAAHSRHFMPIGVLKNGREQTTLVFDTFANVGDGELLVHWPCELDDDEADLLGKLVAALGYLGRSESWVEARLIADASFEWNATPCVENERRGPGWEQVSLMASVPAKEYLAWRDKQVTIADSAIKLPKSRKKPNETDRKKAAEPYPPNLSSCLTKDTVWWKGHGWSQPPGSRRVLYWRRSDALQVGVPSVPRRRETGAVECMLLAITTASGNRSALPPVTRTLPQAELFHRAIIGRLGQGDRVDCPELTGKDEFGKPLRDAHEHAHTIPLDLDSDGRIDHIAIYAQMGLQFEAQRAIRTLRRTWTKGGAGDLQLAVVCGGDLNVMRQLSPPFNIGIGRLLGPPEGSRRWKSVTPFVLPKTLDQRTKRRIPGQVMSELLSRRLPPATAVEVDPELTKSLRHFVRRRRRGCVAPKSDAGYGIRLTFSEPVRGPILLGYASHFGLGLFEVTNA